VVDEILKNLELKMFWLQCGPFWARGNDRLMLLSATGEGEFVGDRRSKRGAFSPLESTRRKQELLSLLPYH